MNYYLNESKDYLFSNIGFFRYLHKIKSKK